MAFEGVYKIKDFKTHFAVVYEVSKSAKPLGIAYIMNSNREFNLHLKNMLEDLIEALMKFVP